MVSPCPFGSVQTQPQISSYVTPLSIHALTRSQTCFQSQNHFLNWSHLFVDNILKYLYLLPPVISLFQCQLDFPGLSILLPAAGRQDHSQTLVSLCELERLPLCMDLVLWTHHLANRGSLGKRKKYSGGRSFLLRIHGLLSGHGLDFLDLLPVGTSEQWTDFTAVGVPCVKKKNFRIIPLGFKCQLW